MSYRLSGSLAALVLLILALINLNHHLPFDVSLSSLTAAPLDSVGEMTLASFTDAISASGVPVAVKSKVRQPFFSAEGMVLAIENEDVQVYEYHAADTARSEAGSVSPDGSTIAAGDALARVEWVATPHFYQRDRLIVVYVGHNRDVLDVLEGALGAPFAGAGRYHGLRALIP